MYVLGENEFVKGTSNPTHQYPPSMSAANRDVIGTSKPTHQQSHSQFGITRQGRRTMHKTNQDITAQKTQLENHGTCLIMEREPMVSSPAAAGWSEILV
jgi:hypothetical protein